MFVLGSLREQHTAVALDDGGDHGQGMGILAHERVSPAPVGAATETVASARIRVRVLPMLRLFASRCVLDGYEAFFHHFP
jgi:hypothetical protein